MALPPGIDDSPPVVWRCDADRCPQVLGIVIGPWLEFKCTDRHGRTRRAYARLPAIQQCPACKEWRTWKVSAPPA